MHLIHLFSGKIFPLSLVQDWSSFSLPLVFHSLCGQMHSCAVLVIDVIDKKYNLKVKNRNYLQSALFSITSSQIYICLMVTTNLKFNIFISFWPTSKDMSINPWTPMSDDLLNSPYSITLKSIVKVTRIKEIITNLRISQL